MRLWIVILVCMLGLTAFGQETITFTELYERYDTSHDHQFLRHIYKNLRHPEKYGQNGNIVVLKLSADLYSWRVELVRSEFSDEEEFIIDIIKEGFKFLSLPNQDVEAYMTINFHYMWRDGRNDDINYTDYDIVVSRSEPISCGSRYFIKEISLLNYNLDNLVQKTIRDKADLKLFQCLSDP